MRHGAFGLMVMLFLFGDAGFVVGQVPSRPPIPVPVDGQPGDPEPGLRTQGGEPGLDQPIHNGRLLGRLLDLPADERFERRLKWSLPGERDNRIPVTTCWNDARKKQGGSCTVWLHRARIPLNEVVSTMTVLADAAKEAGKLDELTAIADRLAGQKLENAELLRIIVYLSQGKGKEIEPVLKSYSEAALKRLTKKPELGPNRGEEVRPSEYLMAKFCLRDPALYWFADRMLGPMLAVAEYSHNYEYVGRLHNLEDQLGSLGKVS